MRLLCGFVMCSILGACMGGGQDAETYVPPSPAAQTGSSTGVSVSGYARVGVEKGD